MAWRKAYDVYADSRTVDHDEWLRLRRTGVGGSDAGAIMGVNPYKGAFSVWADKMGYESSIDDSEAMRQGRDLEEYVARRFAEKTGRSVHREYGMLRNREHPCMVANIDRRVRGSKSGLECKTSRDIYMRRYRDDDIPMEYYCQCVHYMAVTGWRSWYLAVLVYGTAVLTYKLCRAGADLLPGEEEKGVRKIDVTEDDVDALIAAEEAFWTEHVERGAAPPPDGLQSTSDVLKMMYGDSEDFALDSTEEDDRLIEQLLGYKQQKKAAEYKIRELENRLKERMKEAEELRSPIALVSWRPHKQRRISESLLREKYPDVDVELVKESVDMRRFAVREEE